MKQYHRGDLNTAQGGGVQILQHSVIFRWVSHSDPNNKHGHFKLLCL